jgi:predicted dehydrogenase/NADPH:quinone reductase-like Zn-dependent oxidoreductase
MRQLFLDKGMLAVKEVSQPALHDNSVLVAVAYSCISSEHEVRGVTEEQAPSLLQNVPRIIKKMLEYITSNGIEVTKNLMEHTLDNEVSAVGYSCSGRVIATGKKVFSVRAGDYVACSGVNLANHADIVCVPEHRVVAITNREYLRAASVTAVGARALQSVRRARLQLGEQVCVVGLGLLGQVLVQLAKSAGCTVIGIDERPHRRQRAQEGGADTVFSAQQDLVQDVMVATQRYGVDAVLITSDSVVDDAFMANIAEFMRFGGRVVMVCDRPYSIGQEFFAKKEIDLFFSCPEDRASCDSHTCSRSALDNQTTPRWTEQRGMQAFLSMLERGEIVLDALIVKEVSLDDIYGMQNYVRDGEGLGVIIRYPYESLGDVKPKIIEKTSNDLVPRDLRFVPALSKKIRVGIVGAGGFAQVRLLPIIAQQRNVEIAAVVDIEIAQALSVARIYGTKNAFVHSEELYVKDLVDVVVVASPHRYHSEQAFEALRNGKPVFIEKPLVTDWEQLVQWKNFLRVYPDAPLCVDFNRSQAPFVDKIKTVIKQRKTPLMVHYRMNAGFIPKDHWIQTDIGAGRIIGEACHILDLFCYLTDSNPIAVSVEAVHSPREDVFPTDNFVAHISFEDGSICSLFYSALGHAGMSRERMELFYDGKVILMTDYQQLHGFGFPSLFNEVLAKSDKGYEKMVKAFFGTVRQSSFVPPVPFDRLLTSSSLTLTVDQLACEGGGVDRFGTAIKNVRTPSLRFE